MARRPDYDLSDFTNDGTLKIPATLWVVIAYLSRHLLLLFAGGVTSLRGIGSSSASDGVTALYSEPVFLLVTVPAFVVVFAAFRRVPHAGALPRAIWRNGSWWLSAAAVADLAMTIAYGALDPHTITVLQIGAIIVDVYVLVYLWRSSRVKDTFADFPEPREATS